MDNKKWFEEAKFGMMIHFGFTYPGLLTGAHPEGYGLGGGVMTRGNTLRRFSAPATELLPEVERRYKKMICFRRKNGIY